MTDIADYMAQACVKAQEKKADYAPELKDTRSRFEASTAKERALRDYAKNLEGLAARRSIDEDTSLGGYADTAVNRLMPIPHTLSEAAVRGPATAAGGLGGYLAGKRLEESDKFNLRQFDTLDPDALQKVLTDAATGDESSQLRSIIEGHHKDLSSSASHGLAPDVASTEIKDNLGRLARAKPTDVAAALHDKPATPYSAEQLELRKVLADTMKGEQHIPVFRRQALNQINKGEAPTGAFEELMPSLKPYRLGGALAGMAIGGVASGIPYALRALYQKHQGGEAAVRARNKMQEAISQAEAEQASRQGLLAKAGVN